MQAYMKSTMPYLGVPTPQLRAVCRTAFAEHPLGTFGEWRQAILTLWREAQYREERYAAIVTQHRSRLSALSKREALKGLLRSGRVKTVP